MHAPGCDKPALTQLFWLSKSGEPPGDPGHNIAYDSDTIEICPSCNGATLEALRHDCFDFEEVHDQYEWYEFEPEDGLRLRAIASGCGQPLNPVCSCAAHTSLRTSAQRLPRTSWDTIFEPSHHRHIVSITKGDRPALTLKQQAFEAPAPAEPPAPDKPKTADTATVVFIFIAWPAAMALSIYVWNRWVSLPLIVDAFAFLLAVPATFVVTGILFAAAKVVFARERRSTSSASDQSQPQ
jgi:hypothetical protein